MGKTNELTEDTVVMACRIYSDYVSDEKHVIDLSKIWGIELHWRCDQWNVVVVTKEKDLNLKNVTYELDHWVPNNEIKKLMTNPKVTIREIVNFHSSKNFIEELHKVLN